MRQYNPKKERTKYRFFKKLKEADGKGNAFIKSARSAIYKYEKLFNFEDLELFDQDKAIAFKNHLLETPSQFTGETISYSYLLHTTRYLQIFFQWLCNVKGYEKKIKKNDISYFNISNKDKSIALATSEREYAPVEDIIKVIHSMPFKTKVEKRNKALLCLLLLTGARISALITLKIKHINIEKHYITQNPKEVKTKNSKRIKSWFFPVENWTIKIIQDYLKFLGNKNFTRSDPLFPRNLNQLPPLSESRLDKTHWKSANPARKIISQAFIKNGLPAYCPHSFRNSLVQLAYKHCRTPEEFKAWSANLGHKSTLTTFTSYGYIDESRQGDIILGLANKNIEPNKFTQDQLNQIASIINKKEV